MRWISAVTAQVEKELQIQRQHHEAAMDNILLQVSPRPGGGYR